MPFPSGIPRGVSSEIPMDPSVTLSEVFNVNFRYSSLCDNISPEITSGNPRENF